jgi:hypothetical protein
MLNTISFDHRVLFCGKTRSGKTFLASRLTSTLPRLIVFDNLDRVNMPYATKEEIEAFIAGDDVRVKIGDVQVFDHVVKQSFNVGYYTAYIDELYSLVPHPQKIPDCVSMLWTRGGGNNIGAWACVQRPSRIPLFVITELEHLFVFKLKNSEDRKRAWDFVGINPPLPNVPNVDPHGFYYYSDFNPDNHVLYVSQFDNVT